MPQTADAHSQKQGLTGVYLPGSGFVGYSALLRWIEQNSHLYLTGNQDPRL